MAERTFRSILDELDAKAWNPVDKGQSFERLVKAFIQTDKGQSSRFERVWLWSEWPGNGGRHDIGIDLVARERDSGDLVALQCKFYSPNSTVYLSNIATFLAASGETAFSSGIIVSTTESWSKDLGENILLNRDKPISRWGPDVFEKSSVDWQTFDLDKPSDITQRQTKTLREYQRGALEAVINGLKRHDRGKLIMACGTGKTFNALRIAEQQVGADGNVLFLTPSISLLSQSLLDWANDADVPLKTFAVCSDTRAGKRDPEDEDISPYDLAFPASTDIGQFVGQVSQSDRVGHMTAIFSTYQSLDVISEAQKAGLPEFDLIICDEAHRTTGVSLVGKSESNFQLVHDNGFVAARKRLYMTATPRIYGDRAKRKANDNLLTIASMDDETIYGPELHRLGFGEATDLKILSPYKVVIFNVDQEQVGIDLDKLLSDSATDVNMDNAARMVGCWNGLGKRGASGLDFTADPRPAKRAVAFSNTRTQSRQFTNNFPTVTEACIDAAGDAAENLLKCAVAHVDGTQNALERSRHLDWLREETDDGVCRILSNARCLTEGIDVPALDAILFLHPRRSDIDVVQAVGRVMRRAEGKNCGYIILPIAQAPNVTTQETVNNSAYRAVWQVINAISAHDDRFEAQINQLALTLDKPAPVYPNGTDIGRGEPGSDSGTEIKETQGALPLMIVGSPRLRNAILAKIVDKYADPGYWEKWATTVREIAERHEARIRALLNIPDKGVRPVFEQYLAGIQSNLNDGITEDEAIGMLSQHLITKPVFDALFEEYDFTQKNPVSLAMQSTLESLQEHGLENETEGLETFYRDVRVCVQDITEAAGKQKVIAELYQRFFKLALPDTAAHLGIVYTPVEVVDYIISSVEDVLNQEFNASVSDEGVHVLDPFIGTGTFITRLLRSGLIRPGDLRRKYSNELHANDIMLLAYYVAAINIESTWHDVADASEYHPFNGIVLTDTFQSYEESNPMDEHLFPRNNERIERQKGLDIRVIVGNPPWSATNNRKYTTVDGEIRSIYAAASVTTNLNHLYDPYMRAIRLASDRIQESQHGGIVAFVVNGGFIDSNSFDGFRKALATEFHAVYCYNLRGDQRTAGEKSRQEAGKIFGSGSRAGVAILILVKKPGPSTGATIYYRDIGDYLLREAKLEILGGSRLTTTEWQLIKPNEHGDWIGQRSASFTTLYPLFKKEVQHDTPIFILQTPGVKTNRDYQCYNYSRAQLSQSVTTGTALSSKIPQESQDFRVGLYRPFQKQWINFNRKIIARIRKMPELYPNHIAYNRGISIVSQGSNNAFHCLMTESITDSEFTSHTFYLPRYRYVPAKALTRPPDPDNPELDRVSNINPNAVAQFRIHYGAPEISEDDLFYYTYGVLHSQQWRETFADDLAKTAARIPMAATAEDFHAFATAGLELADLHVYYETAEPYPLLETHGPDWNPDAPNAYRVEKMTYAGPARNPDKSAIICNANITLSGIPEAAHHYRLGSRSALDWLIDRYQVTTHKASGIVNDPNNWATERGDPRYIIDLIKRITAVSVRTVEVVQGLPDLPIEETKGTEARTPQKWEFQILADEWERERPRGVDIAEMAKHPAYQQIIEMGNPAVGWLLEKLAEKPGHWFLALNRITGANPVPEQSQGRLKDMTEAWLSWGKADGYKW